MVETRRTQVERSATTRKVLIGAAVDSLVEHGWAATTTVEVCRRTGLTRGAVVHHFPSLPSLLASALEAVYDDLIRTVVREPATLVDAIDVTWACIGDRRFKAVIESWLAAANDRALAREIGPVVANFAKLVSPDGALRALTLNADARLLYLTAREAMLGLALGRALSAGRALPHEEAVLDELRARAADVDGAPRS